MPDAVTVLHVGDPQSHAAGAPDALPARVTVDWHLLHAGSPLVPGAWYAVALPASSAAVSSSVVYLLAARGFTAVTPTYSGPHDTWPAELPCPGWVAPASAPGGASVQAALQPRPAMAAARARWGGPAALLGQAGLDPRAMVLEYALRQVRPRAVDGAAYLLPSGLWVARGPSGQVTGNSPSELAAKGYGMKYS